MELHIARICCISYREPLLWVVVAPLSALSFFLGWRLVRWTAAARRLRWPVRVVGLLLGAITAAVIAEVALPYLSLLLSGGQDRICTHVVKPALLLPLLSSMVGAVWSAARAVGPASNSAS